MVDRYPIDVDKLHKGDAIEIKVIEAYGKCLRTDRRYGLAALKMIQFIHSQSEQAGRPLVAKMEKDRIVILGDNDASVYIDGRLQQCSRVMRRQFEALVTRVHEGELTNEQREDHLKRLLHHGIRLAALDVHNKKQTQSIGQD